MENIELKSLVTEDGYLELFLESGELPEPGDEHVIIEMQASPINPSDMGPLLGPADMSTAEQIGTDENPRIRAAIPEAMRGVVAPRVGKALTFGNEGAGIVVAAGASELAQSLLGKTVAVLGGAMYSKYRMMKAKVCLIMPEGTTPAEAASCFVNPLTAMGMVETMRAEGHTALVHTAAASNLGQMLQKHCINEGVQLVNIVRKQEQVDILKSIGAKHVCNSSDDDFTEKLIDALAETGATVAFDATGGGTLAGQILAAMEVAASRQGGGNAYGSTVHKQVYIYGGLDTSPTTFKRAFGMAWGMGGWLLTPFLQKIGFEAAQKLREKVAAEIKTTFASTYVSEASLEDVLSVEAVQVYSKMATGEKYLINPSK
ncbi:MAG: zinc-binding dehydrogenase [Pseudomonadales bacterium]|nr:zinc-binding dehydrogenase [Pseudomonadales bacterium]